MEKKPIKRSAEMTPLSREHHFSLLFSWKILQGIKHDVAIDRIASYVDYFWKNNLRLHFNQEEAALFNKFSDNRLVKQALAEHAEILAMVQFITGEKETNTDIKNVLSDLANLIKSHVRMEERELFPMLEKQLSEEALREAADTLHHMHPEPIQDSYSDEFWVIEKRI